MLLFGSVCLFWTACLALVLACLMILNKISMEFTEGSRGIYRPIRVLFDTPIYEQALKICWHTGSYKSQIALETELLRLQKNNQLPSEVTAEDMSELLVEESKNTLRVQLWDLELENFDPEARLLLNMVCQVNNSLKMRDVEFEARKLLSSPRAVPAQLRHPKIICQAQKYARILTEQQQEAPSSKVVHTREVVMEVVPKVLQGFWLSPPNTSFNMPSQKLSKMAVGVTKAVEDRVSAVLISKPFQICFSRSFRDQVVLEKVRQRYSQDVLVKKLNCFAADVLNTIADVAAGEICALFPPQTHKKVSVNINTEEDYIQPADVLDGVEGRETVSAVITPPPAPLATSAKPPSHKAIHNCLNCSLEVEELLAHSPQPDSAVVYTPPPPLTPADESTLQEEMTIMGQPVKVDASFNTTTEVKKTEMNGFSCFFSWLQQNLCCCILPEDDPL
ncbi:uncharacterized protein LOC127367353 [Dicentrarchus labrax]|uniref:uncharacterized protein LOC127367353 n=1 Tax=Dicentrarchus labrax TaxID=13489 RepID=UPI0021F58D30|nr:uncharacterized protein LOC127367353 [Dicentrarchus labrax]